MTTSQIATCRVHHYPAQNQWVSCTYDGTRSMRFQHISVNDGLSEKFIISTVLVTEVFGTHRGREPDLCIQNPTGEFSHKLYTYQAYSSSSARKIYQFFKSILDDPNSYVMDFDEGITMHITRYQEFMNLVEQEKPTAHVQIEDEGKIEMLEESTVSAPIEFDGSMHIEFRMENIVKTNEKLIHAFCNCRSDFGDKSYEADFIQLYYPYHPSSSDRVRVEPCREEDFAANIPRDCPLSSEQAKFLWESFITSPDKQYGRAYPEKGVLVQLTHGYGQNTLAELIEKLQVVGQDEAAQLITTSLHGGEGPKAIDNLELIAAQAEHMEQLIEAKQGQVNELRKKMKALFNF